MNQLLDPSVSYLEEIRDQNLQISGAGWGDLLTSISCIGVSWALGNDGHLCTATVECQNNCR